MSDNRGYGTSPSGYYITEYRATDKPEEAPCYDVRQRIGNGSTIFVSTKKTRKLANDLIQALENNETED
jgi:hypothetical protein